MEFLLYLNPQGQQLIRDMISAKFHIHENVGICRNRNNFGYTKTPNKFVVCTNNIKRSGFDTKFYINETLYHEAVHVAQICKGTKILGLKIKNMPLSSDKIQSVKSSFNSTSNNNYHREYEAYYLEDKSEQVRQLVRKFCF